MSAENESGTGQERQPIPKGQKFMDNLLWLFAVSLLLSFIVYNAWGLIELANVK